MVTCPVYASDFEVYPNSGEAFEHLSPLLGGVRRIEYTLRVDNPSVNRGQMASTFDDTIKTSLRDAGAQNFDLRLPAQVPQEYDFAFAYRNRVVAVEVEKTNREKILRDLLEV